MPKYLEALTKAVRKKYGNEAEHMQTVLVNEIVAGNAVWEGAVEVFGLQWNPKAKRCYAWGRQNGVGWDITTVLGIRPVISPRSAVQAAAALKVKLA